MDWKKEWEGKHVFLQLKTGSVYNGNIIEVDDTNPNLIWITIIDKFNEKITIIVSEILKIKEEKEDDNRKGNSG